MKCLFAHVLVSVRVGKTVSDASMFFVRAAAHEGESRSMVAKIGLEISLKHLMLTLFNYSFFIGPAKCLLPGQGC